MVIVNFLVLVLLFLKREYKFLSFKVSLVMESLFKILEYLGFDILCNLILFLNRIGKWEWLEMVLDFMW